MTSIEIEDLVTLLEGSRGPQRGLRMEKKLTVVFKWYMESKGFIEKGGKTQERDRAIYNKMGNYFRTRNNVLTWNNHPKRLTREDVRTFREYLLTRGKNGKPLANDTVTKYLTKASKAIEEAGIWMDWELPNPFEKMGRGLPTSPRRRTVTDDERKRIIIALKEPYRAIFQFMLETGLRIGECLDLTWDRIDGEEKLIWFSEQDHKSGKMRGGGDVAIVLTKEVIPIILDRSKVVDGPYVFHVDGQRVRYDRWHKRFEAARESAGVASVQARDARRTFATKRRNSGVDIEALSAQLRHADVRITQKVYAPASHHVARRGFE